MTDDWLIYNQCPNQQYLARLNPPRRLVVYTEWAKWQHFCTPDNFTKYKPLRYSNKHDSLFSSLAAVVTHFPAMYINQQRAALKLG